jgi:hypothetical protein
LYSARTLPTATSPSDASHGHVRFEWSRDLAEALRVLASGHGNDLPCVQRRPRREGRAATRSFVARNYGPAWPYVTAVYVGEMADRPPVPLADGQVVELGSHRVRHIDTPHVQARGVLFEESTWTLLCGDLSTHFGDGPALTDTDIVGPAVQAEDVFGATCLTPRTGATIRELAALAPVTLAVMHGSCYQGDPASALLALADVYDGRLAAALV